MHPNKASEISKIPKNMQPSRSEFASGTTSKLTIDCVEAMEQYVVECL